MLLIPLFTWYIGGFIFSMATVMEFTMIKMMKTTQNNFFSPLTLKPRKSFLQRCGNETQKIEIEFN